MATPLYRFLKEKGSTFYAFPGAAEDLSSSFQNDNYKIGFSKFVLLKLNVDEYKYTVREGGPFTTDSISQETLNNADSFVNSLRNYVSNHEEVLRSSLVNNTDFFYDPTILETTSEKIFWKWLKDIGGIQFEPALPDDEYIDSADFQVDETLPTDYFKEYVWKERDSIQYRVETVTLTSRNILINNIFVDEYKITTTSSTTLKPEDNITMTNNGTISAGPDLDPGESRDFTIFNIEDDGISDSRNNLITIHIPVSELGLDIPWNNFIIADIQLIYDKTIKYIGEISAINNTLIENKAFTEVWAYLPNQNGATADILFRNNSDHNYSPGQQFPILPIQDQPEIIGAESFQSPIITNPEMFPGDQYAQFNSDQKYNTSQGFEDRKRGPYYGIPTATDRTNERVAQTPYVWPEFEGEELDGISVDFDIDHYSKMNLPGKTSSNFDEFNATSFNDEPPADFEFNAILWYYEVEDTSQIKTETDTTTDVETTTTDTGESTTITTVVTEQTLDNTKSRKATNLYGITILNGLDQEEFNEELRGIPTYKKLVTTEDQDGLSYSFSLNLNFNILAENLVETFDPAKVYSLFGFDLYTEVMRRMTVATAQFTKLIEQNTYLEQDILNLKSLIYTQTSIEKINFQIQSLYDLLNLYSTLQIESSSSIAVETDVTQSPPALKLHTTDSRWGEVQQFPVSTLYNEQTNIATPISTIVPSGKDFLIMVTNNDQADIQLNGKLNIVLDRDLDYKQTCQFLIWPDAAKFNKKLTISIRTNVINNSLFNQEDGFPLLENINLPIDLNTNPNQELDSIFTRWNNIPNSILVKKVNINQISDSYYLNLEIDQIYSNTLRLGDVVLVENSTINYKEGESIDLSGQYSIATEITDENELQVLIDPTNGSIIFDELEQSTSNKKEIPLSMILQPITISFNTGWKITITNADRESTSLNEKYIINVEKFRKEYINEI